MVLLGPFWLTLTTVLVFIDMSCHCRRQQPKKKKKSSRDAEIISIVESLEQKLSISLGVNRLKDTDMKMQNQFRSFFVWITKTQFDALLW